MLAELHEMLPAACGRNHLDVASRDEPRTTCRGGGSACRGWCRQRPL